MNKWAKLYEGVHAARLEGSAWVTLPHGKERLRIQPLVWVGYMPTVAGTTFEAVVKTQRPGGATLGQVNASGEGLKLIEADAAMNWSMGMGGKQRPGRVRVITWDDVLSIVVERQKL